MCLQTCESAYLEYYKTILFQKPSSLFCSLWYIFKILFLFSHSISQLPKKCLQIFMYSICIKNVNWNFTRFLSYYLLVLLYYLRYSSFTKINVRSAKKPPYLENDCRNPFRNAYILQSIVLFHNWNFCFIRLCSH